MLTAKIFTNGRSQAVRLPKEYRFKEEEVIVKKVGDMLILIPKDKMMDIFEASFDKFPEDFTLERGDEKEEKEIVL